MSRDRANFLGAVAALTFSGPGIWRSSTWFAAALSLASCGMTQPVRADALAPTVAVTRFQGRPAPALEVETRGGEIFRLQDIKGRVVVVNLWATWCGPCRAELPGLERLAGRHPHDLVVLAIAQDEAGWRAVDPVLAGHYPHLRAVLPRTPNLGSRLGAMGLPFSLILDRQGREIARVPRGATWDDGPLAALVEAHLADRQGR